MMSNSMIGAKPPFIPNGVYPASYFGGQTRIMYIGRPKLYLTFMVYVDNHIPIPIQKYYNVKRLSNGGSGDINAFEFGWKSNVFRDYVRLFGMPADIETFSSEELIDAFHKKTFQVQIITVTNDSTGEALPKALHYSRIERILSVIEEQVEGMYDLNHV